MTLVVSLDDHTPDSVAPPDAEWANDYEVSLSDGRLHARNATVVFAGCARNCGPVLRANLWRIEQMGAAFAGWAAVIVENDSTDGTKECLDEWAMAGGQRTIIHLNNGRPHLHGFEAERMQAMAEYRNAYLDVIRDQHPRVDYVVVLDLDTWGGYGGLLTGISELANEPHAVAMASVSLFQARVQGGDLHWLHYDQFAFRWFDWSKRLDAWFPAWRPPVGAPPLRVKSAFGGMAVYDAFHLLSCDYTAVDGDCEHVGLHRQIEERGGRVYLNPSQRVIVSWEPTDAGQHGDDRRGDVPA